MFFSLTKIRNVTIIASHQGLHTPESYMTDHIRRRINHSIASTLAAQPVPVDAFNQGVKDIPHNQDAATLNDLVSADATVQGMRPEGTS